MMASGREMREGEERGFAEGVIGRLYDRYGARTLLSSQFAAFGLWALIATALILLLPTQTLGATADQTWQLATEGAIVAVGIMALGVWLVRDLLRVIFAWGGRGRNREEAPRTFEALARLPTAFARPCAIGAGLAAGVGAVVMTIVLDESALVGVAILVAGLLCVAMGTIFVFFGLEVSVR